MGPAILFLLFLQAATPLLCVAQAKEYFSIDKPPKIWINSNSGVFFNSLDRSISTNVITNSDFELWIEAGFYCVSPISLSACDEFLFALSIGVDTFTPQIVWSANRDHPVKKNATLEFTTDGNLVLRDADGSNVWSSNSAGRSVAGMMITEIGNLALFDHKNATVWQSFAHPTDTLVLVQSLVEGMRLTSNTSAKNHFYISVHADGLYAFVESVGELYGNKTISCR